MKYIAITGAYGGMGYATTKKMVEMGYTVFALDKVVKQAEENIIPIEFDITNSKRIENAFNLISEKTEKLDIELFKNFYKDAEIPYVYKNGTYALPDTQNFFVMFYRKDILEKLQMVIENLDQIPVNGLNTIKMANSLIALNEIGQKLQEELKNIDNTEPSSEDE